MCQCGSWCIRCGASSSGWRLGVQAVAVAVAVAVSAAAAAAAACAVAAVFCACSGILGEVAWQPWVVRCRFHRKGIWGHMQGGLDPCSMAAGVGMM